MSAERLIERFAAVYGDPRTTDVDMFLQEYRKALNGFSDDALERAGDELLKRAKFWPRPSEVYEAANLAAAQIYAVRHPKAPEPPPELPNAEQRAKAMAIIADLKRKLQVAQDEVSVEPEWERGQKDKFEQLRRASRAEAHRDRGLTRTSRRMTGERD